MNDAGLLIKIKEAVYSGNLQEIRNIATEQEVQLIPGPKILEALTSGMGMAGTDLYKNLKSVPEFLFSVDTFREIVRICNLKGKSCGDNNKTVLIGVAEGEVHDLGKNIVGAVLEASGFNVIDMECSKTRDMMLDEIGNLKPELLALSAMMSTCIPAVKDTVLWVNRMYPQVKVIVGGAAIDPDLAAAVGAHGYAENANGAVNEANRLLGL